jgi:hypothetical protein
MSLEQENFAELRRLLVLKRYEQPPPGYFAHFSGEVIARLHAGGCPEEKSLLHRLPWLERFWAALETQPVFAGAVGLAVCGLLVSGIIYTERAEPLATVGFPVLDQPSATIANVSSDSLSPWLQGSGRSDGGMTLEPPKSSLFQEIRDLRRLQGNQQPLFAPVVDRRPYYPAGVN